MTTVFPTLPGLDIGVKRTIQFATSVQTSASSGKELRAQWWSSPRYEWELDFNFLRQNGFGQATYDEALSLHNFFDAVGGQYTSFWFTDPYNNSVTAQNFGIGNGSTQSFQIVDAYGVGVANNGAIQVYQNGVLTSAYTISNGVVAFTPAPANTVALTWTGSYYYNVRFAQDNIDIKQFAHLVWQADTIKLISVK
jgi:uncharacterized protein (TIGR02217 family)